MNPLPTMLRDFAKRCLQWADVLEREFEDTGLSEGVKEVLQILDTPSEPSPRVPASTGVSLPWRRGDYFFCEGCGQRRQWFRETAPWRGAICATCYNAELARIEAARGKKA